MIKETMDPVVGLAFVKVNYIRDSQLGIALNLSYAGVLGCV